VALLATFFKLVFVAIAGANMLNHFAVLILLNGWRLSERLHRLRTFGFDIALAFFGFHCHVIGSTFLPRILGIGLAIEGMGYLAKILATAVPPAMIVQLSLDIMLPAWIAEISLVSVRAAAAREWPRVVAADVGAMQILEFFQHRPNGFAGRAQNFPLTGTPPVTHTYVQAIKQPTLHYLTRSVRRRAATSNAKAGQRRISTDLSTKRCIAFHDGRRQSALSQN
jgi:uncharacterized protein DUF4386